MDFYYFADIGLIENILEYFSWRELLHLELVSHVFLNSINQEIVWRRASNVCFQDKKFIPGIVTGLLEPGNNRETRRDLEKLSVRELKKRCLALRIDLSHCVEKSDLISALNNFELRTSNPNEPLAKFALRIAWADRKRTTITKGELCSLNWCIRVRRDGPLNRMSLIDPWWQGLSAGRVIFYANGDLEFRFPEGKNPFPQMGSLTYVLEDAGSIVKISVGVAEHVLRHPKNWGWMLTSGGTVWTGFEMPKLGEDALIMDDNVNSLVIERINYGYRL